MGQLNKTAVVNGTPLEYAPDDLGRDRFSTIVMTGTSTVTLTATHLDNDPYVLLSNEPLPVAPQILFGVGFRKITIMNTGAGTLFATIAGARD